MDLEPMPSLLVGLSSPDRWARVWVVASHTRWRNRVQRLSRMATVEVTTSLRLGRCCNLTDAK